jgi:hypothetical protein
LANKLNEMEDIYNERELKIVCLRKELDKTVSQLNTNMRFEKSLVVLDKILNVQRSPFDRTRLGYSNSQKNIDFEIL